jgi:hypothetical protein
MISTWISGQEDGHATQVAINAVTGEVWKVNLWQVYGLWSRY